MDSSITLHLSVVLPCFDEQECITAVVREIDAVLDGLDRPSEIVCVDDASRDDTVARLVELRRELPRVRVVRHRVNSGQSAALATGFAHAHGVVVVTMDADGQHDPADIPRLVEVLESTDLVTGVRHRRHDDWVKRVSSKVGNAFRNLVTGDRITDAGCTFRAVRRAALREVPVFNGMHRFLPTLMRSQGFAVRELEVGHRPRIGGRSKYGVANRAWRGVLDCLAVRWWRWRAVPADRADRAVAGDAEYVLPAAGRAASTAGAQRSAEPSSRSSHASESESPSATTRSAGSSR